MGLLGGGVSLINETRAICVLTPIFSLNYWQLTYRSLVVDCSRCFPLDPLYCGFDCLESSGTKSVKKKSVSFLK